MGGQERKSWRRVLAVFFPHPPHFSPAEIKLSYVLGCLLARTAASGNENQSFCWRRFTSLTKCQSIIKFHLIESNCYFRNNNLKKRDDNKPTALNTTQRNTRIMRSQLNLLTRSASLVDFCAPKQKKPLS